MTPDGESALRGEVTAVVLMGKATAAESAPASGTRRPSALCIGGTVTESGGTALAMTTGALLMAWPRGR